MRKLKNTRVRPADISFRVDHSLGESHWRTPIQSLLFNVTTSNSVNDPGSYSEDARIKLNILQLQDKEKEKFLIEDKKNKKTGVTVTGEQIMRDFNARKYAFIPAVVSPFGKLGNILERFLFGTEAIPFPAFSSSKPHAKKAQEIATSYCTPQGVLRRAAALWRAEHPGEEYSGTYHAMDPMSSASQKLGRLTCVANGSHILHALDKMNDEPLPAGDYDESQQEDFLIRDNEGDLATCPETRGFATLMTLGGISSELSASGASDSDSSSVETTMPAMP